MEWKARNQSSIQIYSLYRSCVISLLAQAEATTLTKQYEDVIVLSTAAIRQWNIALRERNEHREALAKVQQQHEVAVKEINRVMIVRMKTIKETKRLTKERNAPMQEYSHMMDKRDAVDEEMEKLGAYLTQAFAKITHLESQNKQLVDEKKTLSNEIETLRREISSSLHDRDDPLEECKEP